MRKRSNAPISCWLSEPERGDQRCVAASLAGRRAGGFPSLGRGKGRGAGLPLRNRKNQFFKDWHRSVVRTRLTKVKAVATTLKKHLTNLLTYFVHPITNAISECFNSNIQAIKSDARGFRSFINYRARILFHGGKLSLLPDLSSPSPSH